MGSSKNYDAPHYSLFLQPPIILYLFIPNIFLSTLLSNPSVHKFGATARFSPYMLFSAGSGGRIRRFSRKVGPTRLHSLKTLRVSNAVTAVRHAMYTVALITILSLLRCSDNCEFKILDTYA
jgi:hypothetical protein